MKIFKKQSKKEMIQYVVYFAVQDNEHSVSIIQKQKIAPTIETIEYESEKHTQTHYIDISKPTFKDINRFINIYVIDIHSGQINFSIKDNEVSISSNMNDFLFVENAIEQLARASRKEKQEINWLNMAMALIIGGCIGFILKIFIQI